MKRKMLLFLSAFLLLGMTACGGETSGQTVKTDPSAEETPSPEATETSKSQPSPDAPPVALDASYTDEAGRIFVTYTSTELLEKFVELEEAGYDPYEDFARVFPDKFIQVPVEFTQDYVINSVDHNHMDFFVEIQRWQELDNGAEKWIVLPCFDITRKTESGTDSMIPEFSVKFGDDEAGENEFLIPTERQAELMELLETLDDPYRPYLIRCKITEFKHMDINVKGEAAAHGYSCEMHVIDIVPLE